MQSKRARLDRFISVQAGINRREVKSLLARGRVIVDGCPATQVDQFVDEFTHVRLDDRVLQSKTPIYIMMNKPAGVVSATRDKQHKTVIDCLNAASGEFIQHALHIVGRLDYNSTGLVLLTNDGRWSRQLTTPENKVTKVYRVTLANPITNNGAEEYVDAFASGMYFPYEDLTTQPAKLLIIDEFTAEVHLVEGRYHQIKRMFGRFQNPVLSLHRRAIGNLHLDPELKPGAGRILTERELGLLRREVHRTRQDQPPTSH